MFSFFQHIVLQWIFFYLDLQAIVMYYINHINHKHILLTAELNRMEQSPLNLTTGQQPHW